MRPKTLTNTKTKKQKITHCRQTHCTQQRIHLDARNHYPQIKHHTPPPRRGDTTRNNPSVVSGPNSVPAILSETCCCAPGAGHYSPAPLHGSALARCESLFVVLLRKEVIQPHLPVRLPCYDFVPIASPTFDGSLPNGLGHRLRVFPTFVT